MNKKHNKNKSIIPNPGSTEALKQGCTCPVFDNAYGAGSGFITENGGPTFWYTEGCPVHTIGIK
jgi:hypothetical protein